MKSLNFFFFSIYNRYYKDGTNKNYDSALSLFKTILVIVVPPACLFISLLNLFRYYYINGDFVLPASYTYFIIAVLGLIAYMTFIKDEKYKEIYNEFKDYNKKSQVKGQIISFGIAGAIFLLAVLPFVVIYWSKFNWGK